MLFFFNGAKFKSKLNIFHPFFSISNGLQSGTVYSILSFRQNSMQQFLAFIHEAFTNEKLGSTGKHKERTGVTRKQIEFFYFFARLFGECKRLHLLQKKEKQCQHNHFKTVILHIKNQAWSYDTTTCEYSRIHFMLLLSYVNY